MAEEFEVEEPQTQDPPPLPKGVKILQSSSEVPPLPKGVEIVKKKESTSSNTGGGLPAPTPSSSGLPDIFQIPRLGSAPQSFSIGTVPSSIGSTKTTLQNDLDFNYSLKLSNPTKTDDQFSLNNISALNPNPGILNMPHEEQVESAKRQIENDPDLLKAYRQKRIREINEIKRSAELEKSAATAFVPTKGMNDTRENTTIVYDPLAVAAADAKLYESNLYEKDLQKSIEKTASVAVPRSFIEKGIPLDAKEVGKKWLETVGDSMSKDEDTILADLKKNEMVAGVMEMPVPKYSPDAIAKTQQGIEYKHDSVGYNVLSEYYANRANEIASVSLDKVIAYQTAKEKRDASKSPEEIRDLDKQMNVMLQDKSVSEFQNAANLAEENAKNVQLAIEKYPQVKRTALIQEANDVFFDMVSGDYNPADVTGFGFLKKAWVGVFGRTPDQSEIKEIAARLNKPVEEIQSLVDQGGFFKDSPYPIRYKGFTQSAAGSIKEFVTKTGMGLNRLINGEGATTDNAVSQKLLDEYNIEAQKNKLVDQFGNLNINPGSIFSTMGRAVGQSVLLGVPASRLASLATAGSLTSKGIMAATTVASIYPSAFEDGYQEAATHTADEDVRRAYAHWSALSNSIPEVILPEGALLNKLRGIGVKKGFAEFTKEVGEKGLLATTREKTVSFGKEFLKVAALENVEEQMTNISTNIADEELLGIKKTASEWWSQAFHTALQTTIGTIPLGIGAGLGARHDASGVRKETYFEMGNDREVSVFNLQQAFIKGDISQDQLNQKIQVVNTMADIVSGVNKMTKPDGSSYSYDEKAEIAAQQYRINHNNAIANDNPISAIKAIVEQDNIEAEAIQNNILNPPKIESNENENQKNNGQGSSENTNEGELRTVPPQVSQQEGQVVEPGAAANVVAPVAEDNITISDVIDKPVTYNGQRARVYQDGQAVVVKIEGQPREYEIGNIDELSAQNITDFGITHEESVVSFDEAGDIVVRGKTYQNKYSDPLAAINRDEQGNVVSVNLDLPDGSKRTFRGNIAEDLAYNISLKEISKDNETRQQFEDFLNTDEVSVDLGSVPEITTEETTGGDTEIQRERVTPVVVDNPVGISERGALIQQAVDRADEIQGIYGTAFKGNPEEALRQMAEQLHSPESELEARKSFGDAVSDIALKLFPQQVDIPQSTNLVPDENTQTAATPVSQPAKASSAEPATANENQQRSEAAPPTTGEAPPTTGENAADEGDEEAPVGITQANLAKMREELGLPPYEKTKVTDAELRALADRAIADGYPINKLLDKMDEGGKPNSLEVVILGKYKPVIHAQAIANPTDENLNMAFRFANTVATTTSDIGRGFRLLQEVPQDAKESVIDIMVDMMGDYKVDSLTDEQKAEAQKRWDDIDKAVENEAKLRIEAEAEIERLKAENELLKAKKENKKSTPAKRKKTEDDYREERNKIVNSIKDKWNNAGKDTLSSDIPYRKQLAAIAPDVFKLIGSYVEQQADITLEGVRKLLKKDINDAGIDITDDDVRGLIAGEYNEKRPSRSELSTQVQNLRKEESLLRELEALESGEVPPTNKGKVERNQKLKDIRDRIERFKKENKIGRYSDEEKFVNNLNARIAANKKAQDKLIENIKKGNFSEEQPDDNIVENALLQKNNPKLYDEYIQSIVDKDKALLDYEKARLNDQIAGMGKLEKLGDYVNIALTTSKGAVAMFDQSGVLVQMLITTGAHPIKTISGLPSAIRDLFDKKWFDRRMAKLKNGKMWDLIQKSGLAIMDPEGISDNVRQELLGGRKNLLNRNIGVRDMNFSVFGKKMSIKGGDLKVKGKTFSFGKAFERSTSSLFNNMRLYLFLNQVQDLYKARKTWESHPEEFQAAARAVNELTGHGKVPQWVSEGAPVINNVIWSPKMMASTFNIIGLGDVIRPTESIKAIRKALGNKNIKYDPDKGRGFYSSLTPTQGRFVRNELLRFVGTAAVIMLAVQLLGGDDDEADINPLSTTFGQIKTGDKTINIFGRYGAAIRTLAMVALNKRIMPNGKTDTLGDKYGDKNGASVAFSAFGRGKMTPFAGVTYDYFLNSKENYYTKEKMTVGNIGKSLTIPISFQEIGKDFERDGALKGTFETMFKIYGGNIRDKQDFAKKPKPK